MYYTYILLYIIHTHALCDDTESDVIVLTNLTSYMFDMLHCSNNRFATTYNSGQEALCDTWYTLVISIIIMTLYNHECESIITCTHKHISW